MSRIAKYPVELPKGVEASIQQDQITVKGPLGSLTQALTGDVAVALDNGKLTFVAANETRHANAMSGTVRALVANMVNGVSKGFERKLTLVGVGYRASIQGDAVKLQLGFARRSAQVAGRHQGRMPHPDGNRHQGLQQAGRRPGGR